MRGPITSNLLAPATPQWAQEPLLEGARKPKGKEPFPAEQWLSLLPPYDLGHVTVPFWVSGPHS